MSVIVALMTLVAAGLPMALAVDRGMRGPALVGVAFLYGSGAVYLIELLLALAGLRWSALLVTVLLLLVAAAALIVTRRGTAMRKHSSRPVADPAGGRSALLVDLLTLLVVISQGFVTTVASPWSWDFWAIWGLKGRVFFEAGTIDWRFLEGRWNDFAHPDYPLLLPLNYAHAALLGGSWDDRWLGLYGLAFGLALLLIVRGVLSAECGPLVGAVAALAASPFALSPWVGLADGPFLAFAGAALLFLRRGLRLDDPAALRHGALLLGLAAGCKNEGSALIVAAAVALVAAEPRRWRRVVSLWPAVILIAPWTIARMLHHLQGDTGGGVAQLPERLRHLPEIARALATTLPHPLLWTAMLTGLLLAPGAARAGERFLLTTASLQIAFYIAVYLVTPFGVVWHIETSWPRIATHVAVPLMVAVLVMLAPLAAASQTLAHAEARPDF
jgi:hypothetical protein